MTAVFITTAIVLLLIIVSPTAQRIVGLVTLLALVYFTCHYARAQDYPRHPRPMPQLQAGCPPVTSGYCIETGR